MFDFDYEGGGFWRKHGVPIGEKAEVLHGNEALVTTSCGGWI